MELDLKYINAVSEDAELLSATAIASKKYWGYSDDLIRLWKNDLEVSKDYILNNYVVKVFDKEVFLGFFAIKVVNENAEIDHFWLLPKFIHQNYGRKIFQYIITHLKSIGLGKVTLIAEPNSTGFYDKMGGKIVGEFEGKISGRFLDIYEFRI